MTTSFAGLRTTSSRCNILLIAKRHQQRSGRNCRNRRTEVLRAVDDARCWISHLCRLPATVGWRFVAGAGSRNRRRRACGSDSCGRGCGGSGGGGGGRFRRSKAFRRLCNAVHTLASAKCISHLRARDNRTLHLRAFLRRCSLHLRELLLVLAQVKVGDCVSAAAHDRRAIVRARCSLSRCKRAKVAVLAPQQPPDPRFPPVRRLAVRNATVRAGSAREARRLAAQARDEVFARARSEAVQFICVVGDGKVESWNICVVGEVIYAGVFRGVVIARRADCLLVHFEVYRHAIVRPRGVFFGFERS
mmetsp:Transcript_12650/g.33644  ORF Transcript_12650/g.33644 Transcript_12650/m.33644 type:complete len:304 (-) Transcript_12650:213-1124(-)